MIHMNEFDEAFEYTVGLEGRFSDNPLDSGGPTKYGITERVARAHGYIGHMKDLPLHFAKKIYKASYWDALKLDSVSKLSSAIPHEMFDTGVNMGVKRSATFLQRALNVFNRQGRDYPDIQVDGSIGSKTISSLSAYLSQRGRLGESVMLTALNSQQGAGYFDIAENRPKDEEFIFGWFANRVKI